MLECLRLADLPAPPEGKTGWPWTEEVSRSPRDHTHVTVWPKVSIVTPSFNQGNFLEETIRSVLLQGYPNLEYWVIDGGSTDNSLAVIKKYAPWLTGWVSEKDRGQADAINKGWNRCTGDFLGWINSDDLLLPDAVWASMEAINAVPQAGFVFGDVEYIDETGKYLGSKTYPNFNLVQIVRDCGWISQQGNLIRRSVLLQIGGVNPDLQFLMDFDLWLRAGLVSSFLHIPVLVARFRQHLNAKSSGKVELAAQEILPIYKSFFQRDDLPMEIKKIQPQAMISSLWYSARCYYYSGQMSSSLNSIMKAAWINPAIIFQSRFIRIIIFIVWAFLLGGRNSFWFQRLRTFLRRDSKI